MKKAALLLFLASILISPYSCAANKNKAKENPNMEDILRVLTRNSIEYYLFSNESGNSFLVVPKFGARILAVSVGGENLFWTHPEILKGQGGQRSWVSPEGGNKGFIFKPDWSGNRDFSMLDPGNYRKVSYEENKHLILSNSFKTTSNDGKENYELTLTREFRFEPDPLQDDEEFRGLEYDYLGIDFVHKLKNNSEKMLDHILGLWSLIQIPPGGTMIVPLHEVKREAWRGNYFEPIPEEYAKANEDSYSFFVHGSRRYKVGIHPQYAQGVICYLRETQESECSLVFMIFPVKPEARYPDRPRVEQETNGDAIQIYSHFEEGLLAFGELESQSWALELEPGQEAAFPIKTYLYKGPLKVMKKVGKKLVCSGFERAYIY
ncbi:MAG: DUF6786 family protein [Candidatus Aminicenantales bacterium]